MSFIADRVARTRRVPLHIVPTSIGGACAARSLREDRWENEGGRIAAANPEAASLTFPTTAVEATQMQVDAMESALASDFANGRVGMRYNTYAHRSRVLSQQRAKLAMLHASVHIEEQQP